MALDLGGSNSRSRKSSQEVSGQYSAQTGGSIVATTGGRGNVLPGGTKVTLGRGATYSPTFTTTVTGASESATDASALLAAVAAQANREGASPANTTPYVATGDGGVFDPKWLLLMGALALGLVFFLKRK